jgi:predicted RND superfamily exporter protein
MKMRIIFVLITIFALSLAAVQQLSQVNNMGSLWRKDKELVPTLQDISKLVPKNESIMLSSFDPIVFYFTERHVKVPNKIQSLDSLVNFMEKGNYNYLLTIDGQYNVPKRDSKFNVSQFYMENDFDEIAVYNTDLSRLHLYKRN